MRLFFSSQTSNFLFFHRSPVKERPQTPQCPATPSRQASHRARARGATSALSATRTWWTLCCTPADTCACAMPVASSSRRWPTPAAPSAGGQSKTSSRPTAAHSRGLQNGVGAGESLCVCCVCVCAVVNQSHVILFVKAGVLVHPKVAQVQ